MNAINRRSVLLAGAGTAGAGLLAACSGKKPGSQGGKPELVSPSGSAVAAAADKRTGTGKERTVRRTATAGTVDLGGKTVQTWSYDGELPGKEIRLTAGDTLVAHLANHLPEKTSIHWHGVALRNNMDGVPPITQRAVAPGASFTYRFVADEPGTYWHHPHVGVQLDRGLYGPLIVEDPHEPLKYDDEWVVVLDDWLDGVTGTPAQALAALQKGMGGSGSPSPSGSMDGMEGMDQGGMGGMDMGSASPSPSMSSRMPGMDGNPFMLMGATSKLLGGDAGDVKYPYYLVNGRTPTDPVSYRGKRNQKVRLRIINAGGDTAFRVALGGHRLTITHTDGYPVEHEQVDALLIAPGERYDALVTLKDGVFPLVSLAEGKNASGMALVRTGSGRTPSPTARPRELNGRILASTDLRAADSVRLKARKPDVTHRVELTGSMGKYDWAINGKRFDINKAAANAFLVQSGQRVRLQFVNGTDMWHPMHLHGHTYQVGSSGPRKDTTIVLPRKTVTCDFDADNPGRWLMHCHNVYHGESGMMGLVAYEA
ncbi:multicopper oxidase family protein [Streptomyces montanisoli]|uniref:Multicopper oxidase family protein n=1 Tax=Streptomyces montanisoli TaxID=2798581 RepID=A0A940M767_9ACTN|nr:multicopper oxidase family protein [Streptomyces montanisoli]MBP0456049.1 multicopper oxidase family protein [Streptomyces montanisoli]